MNKRCVLLLTCFFVPSLFPAASSVTPEWAREQQQLEQLEDVRQELERHHTVLQTALTYQRDLLRQGYAPEHILDAHTGLTLGRIINQTRLRLNLIRAQVADLAHVVYADLLQKYPTDATRWRATEERMAREAEQITAQQQ